MWKRYKLTVTGIVVAAAYWPLEAVIHYYIFHTGSFLDNLISPDANELWMRLIISVAFVCFGAYAQRAFNHRLALLERLCDEEERTKRIIDTAFEAFVSIDEDGCVTGWNRQAERIFGWLDYEAMGKDLAELIIPEKDKPRHREGLERFKKIGSGPWLYRKVKVNARHRNGREFPVTMAVVPLISKGKREFFAFIRCEEEENNTIVY